MLSICQEIKIFKIFLMITLVLTGILKKYVKISFFGKLPGTSYQVSLNYIEYFNAPNISIIWTRYLWCTIPPAGFIILWKIETFY